MAKNYNPSAIVYVQIGPPIEALKYGFRSRLAEGQRELFGQKAVTSGDFEGFIFQSQAPRPGRAKKVTLEGSTSGYYDYTQAAALRAEKYTLGFPHFRFASSPPHSTVRFMTINSVKYAYYLPNGENNPEGLNNLGSEIATPGAQDLVFGAAFPFPPRASTLIGGGHTFSTFYAPSVAEIPQGWIPHIEKARFNQAHFSAYISG
jgi:hypothetical protein